MASRKRRRCWRRKSRWQLPSPRFGGERVWIGGKHRFKFTLEPEHDVVRKPLHTFRHHALAATAAPLRFRGFPMVYVAAENRYEKMIYNRCGRSGLKLPAI
ncbi:hypothetical protein EN812_33585, partial [Mesorhizobium sp. M4B.F.Ca.ET.169.01.1.1]